jgi:hypothetical protein
MGKCWRSVDIVVFFLSDMRSTTHCAWLDFRFLASIPIQERCPHIYSLPFKPSLLTQRGVCALMLSYLTAKHSHAPFDLKCRGVFKPLMIFVGKTLVPAS